MTGIFLFIFLRYPKYVAMFKGQGQNYIWRHFLNNFDFLFDDHVRPKKCLKFYVQLLLKLSSEIGKYMQLLHVVCVTKSRHTVILSSLSQVVLMTIAMALSLTVSGFLPFKHGR